MDTKFYLTLIPMFEELQGERVLIRPYREADAQALFDAITESREHIRPWLALVDKNHQTVEDSLDWIIRARAQYLLREVFHLSIWDKSTGRFLGAIGLHPLNWEIGYFSIGYWLSASATGQGYTTEAVKLLRDFAFSSLKAQRVEIRCDERNERSAAVPRRLGFVQEARLRNNMAAPDGKLRNTLVFSQIPEDLLSQN
ncbi:MAG TPA: GNAT family N-acetyltransferase [Ktedonobacteraceae bacterium]|nr:GNAT family N-acetyltransferase [Ktedonobacteraceae bacterium]